MATCPNLHESQAADFCPVCGIEMAAGGGPGPAPVSAGAPEEYCPTCNAKRTGDDGVFCEVCGYNFKTGVCGMPFVPPPAPQPQVAVARSNSEPVASNGSSSTSAGTSSTGRSGTSSASIGPSPSAVGNPSGSSLAGTDDRVDAGCNELRTWHLVASVDLSVTGVSEEDGPGDRTERVFPLDLPDQFIGRRSVKRSVQPEIALDGDDGISHRHAKILRQPDGTFAVLDLGSSNGTALNGTELKPNVLTPLAEGDRIGLGRWTLLSFLAHGSKPPLPAV